SCSCPFFSEHVQVCKHIWATILTAESRNLPLADPSVPPAQVQLVPEPLDDELFLGDDEFLRALVPRASAPRPVAVPARPRPSPVPAPPAPWQQLLDAVTTSAAGRPGELRPPIAGQLIYVLDVDATLASGGLVVEFMARDRKVN